MTEKQRITVTLPEGMKEEIEQLKKEKYYNLSYSELYRQVISAGIESIKDKNKEN